MSSPSKAFSTLTVNPNWKVLGSTIVLMAIAALGAMTQKPSGDPYSPRTGWKWFLSPSERNAWLRIPHARITPEDAYLASLATAEDGQWVWLTTNRGHFFRSNDAGKSWAKLSPATQNFRPTRGTLFRDKDRGWAIFDAQLWTTIDGGETWELDTIKGEGEVPRALWILNKKPSCLTTTGVWDWSAETLAWRKREKVDVSGLLPSESEGPVTLAATESSVLILTPRGVTLIDGEGQRQQIKPESLLTIQGIRVDATGTRYIVNAQEGVALVDPGAQLPASTWKWFLHKEPSTLSAPPAHQWTWSLSADGYLRPFELELLGELSSSLKVDPVSTSEPRADFAMISPGIPRSVTAGTVWRGDGVTRERSLVLQDAFILPFTAPTGDLWVTTHSGMLLRSRNQGRTWELDLPTYSWFTDIWFSSDGHTGYLSTGHGKTYRFVPAEGASTAVLTKKEKEQSHGNLPTSPELACGDLKCKQILPENIGQVLSLGNGVWLAFGDNLRIFRTQDGGEHWERITYASYPAPWYYATWLPVLGLVLWGLGLRGRSPAKSEVPLEGRLVNDRPIEDNSEDVLGLHELVLGLSRFLRNEQTRPSLTLTITGPWGAGKSSLLNLLKWELWQYGMRPVSFNAWHNEQQGNPVAALYDAIISQGMPRLFSPGGFLFRLRLVLVRLWNHPGRIAFFAWLLLFAGAFYMLGEQELTNVFGRLSEAAFQLANVLGEKNPGNEGILKALKAHGEQLPGLLASLVGFVGVIGTLLKSLKGFEGAPAKLLAFFNGSTKASDSQASVGFHARFATDFSEVTRALAPTRMVLLVDDLDRCMPTNALKMLEAINFLVSSGECFVVLAVSREVLEGFLREALKNSSPPTGAPKDYDAATHYLEKIINLEVKIPSMSREHAVLLTSPSLHEHRSQGRRALLRYAERGRTATRLARSTAHGLILAAWLGLGLGMGLLLGPKSFRSAQRPSGPNVLETNATISNSSASTSPPNPPKQNTEPQASAAQTLQVDSLLLPVPENPLARWLIPTILLLLLVPLLRLIRASPVKVTDSLEFQQALEAWMPLLLQRYPTPRALKRFLNRLRYLAMLQGRMQEDEERVLVAAFHGWMEAAAEGKGIVRRIQNALQSAWTGHTPLPLKQPIPAGAPPPIDSIPDTWLVALTIASESSPDGGKALLEELRRGAAMQESQPPSPSVASSESAGTAIADMSRAMAQFPAPQALPEQVPEDHGALLQHTANTGRLPLAIRNAWRQTPFPSAGKPDEIIGLFMALQHRLEQPRASTEKGEAA